MSQKKRRGLKSYFYSLGPGVITGAADDDPAGIVTYLMAGAIAGFSVLWLIILCIPMLIVIEEMSARVGVVAKKGLSKIIREKYGLKAAIFVALIVAVCNIATIGADIGGAASCLELLTGIKFQYYLVLISAGLLFVMVYRSFHYLSRLLFIMTPFLLLYVVNDFIARPDWAKVLTRTFIPYFSFEPGFIVAAIALLGTTLSPYLIFWQTTEEIEEKKAVEELKQESFDVIAGMIYTQLIAYFVVISGAAVFYSKNIPITDVKTAALSLKPLLGSTAFFVFSIGILFSALISVPVLAGSTAYVLAEAFGFSEGLDKKPGEARFFYGVLIASFLIAVLSNLIGIDPVKFLYYSQVLDGILMPFLIYFLIRVTSDPQIMGKNTSSRSSVAIAAFSALLFTILTIFLFYQIIAPLF